MHNWTFDKIAVVRIGRLEGQEVVVMDPQVSRQHAELHYLDGGWQLKSLGRNGVLVDDLRIEEAPARHGMVFRLGPQGPMLSFAEVAKDAGSDSEASRMTCQIDSSLFEQLDIDRNKTDEQVRQITEDGSFQQLLDRARALRKKRPT